MHLEFHFQGIILSDEEIGTIRVSGNKIEGGKIIASKTQVDEENKVKCKNAASKCFEISKIMLVRMNINDEITVEVNKRIQKQEDSNKICLKSSDIDLPQGVSSTVLTHWK